MTTVNATVKWFNFGKNFGFAVSTAGDVFVPGKLVVDAMRPDMMEGAKLSLEVVRAERGLQATKINAITPPWEKGEVKWFKPLDEANPRGTGFGFIHVDGGDDVLLHHSVAEAAGVEPWRGLLVHFLRGLGNGNKPLATRVEFPTLAAEIAALAAEDTATVAEEAAVAVLPPEAPALAEYKLGEELTGTVKWFRPEGWGYIVVEGKQGDLFVHKSGVHPGLTLTDGLSVVCRVGKNPKGFCAEQVRLPGEPAGVSESAEKPKRPHHVVRKRRPESAAAEASAPVAAPRERVELGETGVSAEVGKPKSSKTRAKKPRVPKVFASATPPGGGEADGPFSKLAALKAAMNGGAEAPQVH